tara:strand:- start:784 stop:1296 length:513 start_codon:yes stop_codon:yes gene_type:complete
MKSKGNIVLIGMMGSGKSLIGKILSQKLNLDFIDVDNKIEEIEKMTISEMFKINGEKYFRKVEEYTTINCLKLENKIISLGGGGFINPKIRKQTIKNCISVWLNWKDETLIDRINSSKKRPLAMKLTKSQLKTLIIERSKIYNTSNLKINCDNLDKNQIVDKIVKYYENN